MKISRNLVLAFFIFPFNVMGIIPLFILSLTWGEIVLELPFIILGCFLVALGFPAIYHTVSLFTDYGCGTPAPFDPPKKLVSRGMYRHVRNPMMIGVMLVLIGQSVILVSLPLLGWALFFAVANIVYIPLVEEPKLKKRFGGIYETYLEKTPRWIPCYLTMLKKNKKRN